MSWFQERSQQGTDWFARVQPLQAATALFIYSLVMVALSAVVGVYDYEHFNREVERQVGYGHTLNWAYGFTVVVPALCFFLLRAYQEIPRLAGRLESAGMLLDRQLGVHPNASTQFASLWTRIRRQTSRWWLGATAVGVMISLGEWLGYSALPLAGWRYVPEAEFDWSVKFIGGSATELWLNGGFSLLVFVQQMAMVCLGGLFVHMAIAVARLFAELRKPERAIRLFPALAPSSTDRRLGYQSFSDFFSTFLTSAALFYLQFYLSRVWNAFLHPEKGEPQQPHVWDLMQDGWEVGKTLVFDRGSFELGSLSDFLDLAGANNFSGLVVPLLAMLAFMLSASVLFYSMRRTARGARDELLGQPRVAPSKRERLEKMAIWPFKYPGQVTLLTLGLLGIICMWAYSLGIFFAAAATAAVVVRGVRMLISWLPIGD